MNLKLVLSFAMIWNLAVHLGAAMAIETPVYEVLAQEAPFELRHYRPMLTAQVSVEGDMDEASNKGFRLIAAYIFGSNLPQSEMTLPSTLSAASSPRETSLGASSAPMQSTSTLGSERKGVKIAMTAPVSVQPEGSLVDMGAVQVWRVNFVMPSQYSLKTIPQPQNPAIELQETGDKYYAVMNYSGFNFQTKVQAHMKDTLNWVQSKGYKALGSPMLSRYDPPWTLPFLRRNEIWVEIAKP